MTAPSLTPAAIEAFCGELAIAARNLEFARSCATVEALAGWEHHRIRQAETLIGVLAARVEALEAGQEYDILTEFSRAFLDGWLADENPEVRRHWKRVNERLLPRQAAHLLADTSDA